MPFSHDATGIDPDQKTFTLVPKGWYTFEIMTADEKISKTGRNMVNMRCAVTNDPKFEGASIFHTVVFIPKGQPGDGMSVHFLKCIGEPYEGNLMIDADNWKMKKFRGYVIEDEYNGKKQNKITQVSPVGSGVEVPF